MYKDMCRSRCRLVSGRRLFFFVVFLFISSNLFFRRRSSLLVEIYSEVVWRVIFIFMRKRAHSLCYDED